MIEINVGDIWFADQCYLLILESNSRGCIVKMYYDWKTYHDNVRQWTKKELEKFLNLDCCKVRVEECPKRIQKDYRKHFHAV